MNGYEIRFNVYAESQGDADAAASAIKRMISDFAARGVAVTAPRITHAVEKFSNSPFVINYFK